MTGIREKTDDRGGRPYVSIWRWSNKNDRELPLRMTATVGGDALHRPVLAAVTVPLARRGQNCHIGSEGVQCQVERGVLKGRSFFKIRRQPEACATPNIQAPTRRYKSLNCAQLWKHTARCREPSFRHDNTFFHVFASPDFSRERQRDGRLPRNYCIV